MKVSDQGYYGEGGEDRRWRLRPIGRLRVSCTKEVTLLATGKWRDQPRPKRLEAWLVEICIRSDQTHGVTAGIGRVDGG